MIRLDVVRLLEPEPEPDTPPPDVYRPVSREQQILDILRRPIAGTCRDAFAQIEIDLKREFSQLAPAEWLVLSKRLAVGATDDPIVAGFARLTRERQSRLEHFLTNPKQRLLVKQGPGRT